MHIYIYIEDRRQEGERFINYVDCFFERLDSYNPYFDLEILIIHNLTYQHYIDGFNFRTKFLPSILLSPPIGENRNLCTIIRKRYVQNSPRSVILCIHRLADRPIDTLSLLFTWSGLRARIFSAIRITVPVTGKYRNEFPFNFSLPSSPFIQPSPPVSRYLPLLSFHSLSFSRICLLQLDGSREQTFKRIETRGSAR